MYYIYISLLKINKINFITVLFIKFLKNRAAGHWIKSLSIVCSQKYGKHTPSGIHIPFSLRLLGIRIPSGVYLSVFWEQTMDN